MSNQCSVQRLQGGHATSTEQAGHYRACQAGRPELLQSLTDQPGDAVALIKSATLKQPWLQDFSHLKNWHWHYQGTNTLSRALALV